MDIRTEDHLFKLKEIIKRYDAPISDIVVTSDIMEWCRERKVEESNPFRIAKILKCNETQEYLILLAEKIGESYVRRSVLPVIRHPRVAELEDMTVFIRHLILHEVAHAINGAWGEQECDAWAFEQLDCI